MSELVSLSKDGEVSIITVNNPPVNALSPGVPEGIASAVEAVSKAPDVKAAVLIGGGSTFIAGADIKEFGKVTSGMDVVDKIRNAPTGPGDFPNEPVVIKHATLEK